MRSIHWGAGLRMRDASGALHLFTAGYPVCVSGERAEAIARTPGALTRKADEVTCGTCRRMLVRGGVA